MHDYDGYGYDDDPYYDTDRVGPTDDDLIMAGWEEEGRRLAALERAGTCTHGSTVGYLPPGQECYQEQRGLKPGQVACRDHRNGCNAVFDSEDEWVAARARL